MNRKKGTAASVGSRMTAKNCSCIRYSDRSPSATYPKNIATEISVKAIGKPTKIAPNRTTSATMPIHSGVTGLPSALSRSGAIRTWGGPACLHDPPTLAASPLRCPPRGRNSTLGAALRVSWRALRIQAQDHAHALDQLRDALDDQQRRGQRHDELERPHDRQPRARDDPLVLLVRLPEVFGAELQEHHHRRQGAAQVAT